jgi:hypothetical protein
MDRGTRNNVQRGPHGAGEPEKGATVRLVYGRASYSVAWYVDRGPVCACTTSVPCHRHQPRRGSTTASTDGPDRVGLAERHRALPEGMERE